MITYNLTFTLLLLLLFIFIIFAKSSIETTETTESNNECSCPTEKIFDSNVEDGEFKKPWMYSPTSTVLFLTVNGTFNRQKIPIFCKGGIISALVVKKNQNPTNLLSSINGGLYFNFVTNGINHNFRGFKISFSRKSEGVNNYQFPCPQPFYFATNSLQRLPAFRLGFLDTCIFSINSTKAVKLTINRVNTDSVFGIKVFETESFPNRYENDQEGQLANSSFNSYPLIVKSRTESVSVLISSYEYDAEIVQVPYKIEFIAVENAQNEDFLQNHHSSTNYLLNSNLLQNFILQNYLLNSNLLQNFILQNYLLNSNLLQNFILQNYLLNSNLLQNFILQNYLLTIILLQLIYYSLTYLY
uniref:Uncharacterized protein n=1 Tax=Meloidogyne enterolobii TaxID=390850 RepID=A0A6V7WHS2_MELEN|nr:unnamed protein product [Meloidogyne enterolobii]